MACQDVKTVGIRHKLIAKRYQHVRERDLPYGLPDALCTLAPSCSRVTPLRHGTNTRYGRAANPYPTGTFTRQETPSFARRDNVKANAARAPTALASYHDARGARSLFSQRLALFCCLHRCQQRRLRLTTILHRGQPRCLRPTAILHCGQPRRLRPTTIIHCRDPQGLRPTTIRLCREPRRLRLTAILHRGQPQCLRPTTIRHCPRPRRLRSTAIFHCGEPRCFAAILC